MEKIAEKLNCIVELNEKIGNEFVISRDYKDEREWWILGHMSRQLKKQGIQYPEFAKKTDPPDPDFITYDKNKERFKQIEVCEVTTPGRKRGDEYRDNDKNAVPFKFIEPVNQPWSSFINVLKKKFMKRYGKDCWLLVYHNMFFNEITDVGCWHDLIIENTKLWNGKDNEYSINLQKSPYEKILVLNSKAEAMVEIYPNLLIITPE